MNKRIRFLAALCVLAASLACLLPTPAPVLTSTPPPPPVTPNDDEVATRVAATLTAMASLQPGITVAMPSDTSFPIAPSPTNTPHPSDTPIPSNTPLPPCLPTHPGPQNLPLPAGIAVGKSPSITLFDLQGNSLATRLATGGTWLSVNMVHLAGNLSQGANNLPVVYYSLQNHGTLKSNVNNAITDILSMPNLNALIGAEGRPYLAFNTIDMAAGSINRLYAGDLSQLAGIQPRITWTYNPQDRIGNSLQPLAIRFEAGQARGVWYTYTMYGIGDINFPPYKGLKYLDLSNNQSTAFIDTSLVLGGISPDQTFIAYAPVPGSFARIDNGFAVRNLVTCQETYFPLNAGSNLGGGSMVFSPDNQIVAWVEASGPSNMEAQFRLRVAHADGTSLFDSPVASLTTFLGGETPSSITPVGWASNHLLLLSIYSNTLNRSFMVLWAPDPAQPLDPSLGTHQFAIIAEGSFAGLVYP